MEDNNNINDIVDLTVPGTFKHKVKSILNKAAEFSSKHMFDGSIDTVYNSDGVPGQWIMFDFGRNVELTSFQIMFQGGFVGQDAEVEIGIDTSNMQSVITIEDIEDNNTMQVFNLENTICKTNHCRILKVSFPTTTDFYGRLTIYRMQVFGKEV